MGRLTTRTKRDLRQKLRKGNTGKAVSAKVPGVHVKEALGFVKEKDSREQEMGRILQAE